MNWRLALQDGADVAFQHLLDHVEGVDDLADLGDAAVAKV